jgi:hypothetical protein
MDAVAAALDAANADAVAIPGMATVVAVADADGAATKAA